MATTSLSASPAELPLAGGRAGAAVTLRPLLCAEMRAPIGWFHRAEGPTATLKALGIGAPSEQRLRVPIVAFLLEHPVAGFVLIDTGLHRSVAERRGSAGARNLGPVGRLIARDLDMRADQTVAAQLRTLDIDPEAVELVVMTHLHFDHASALCDFPAATVLVARREWDAARARGSFLRGYSTSQLDPRPTYRTVDFAASEVRPRGPFAQTLDVFADGSLTLASTPGHSAGHLSAILRLGHREALIAGDAIYTMATLREGERPWRSEDPKAFEHSLEAIRAYDRDHQDALIVPGHDMTVWEQLDELYR
jgi:glyoxylase-like metal-dependent hydrolase (beta-lactamase superfamily II)